MSKFNVGVQTKVYTKYYDIEADSRDEAVDKALERAAADVNVNSADSIRREVLSCEERPKGNHFEVHEIEDVLSGEPCYCASFDNYDEALSEYNEIAYTDQKPARFLEVDDDGMLIEEIRSNY